MDYRRRGLLLIAGGVAAGAAVFALLILLSRLGVIEPTEREHWVGNVRYVKHHYAAFWGVPIVIPLFATLFGLIQVLTGRSLGELGAAYETMSGARRFVVSVLIVALALGVIFGLVAIAFAIML